MKNNIIKYIFIVFVIALIGFAFYIIYHDENQNVNEVKTENVQTSSKLTDIRLSIVRL